MLPCCDMYIALHTHGHVQSFGALSYKINNNYAHCIAMYYSYGADNNFVFSYSLTTVDCWKEKMQLFSMRH